MIINTHSSSSVSIELVLEPSVVFFILIVFAFCVADLFLLSKQVFLLLQIVQHLTGDLPHLFPLALLPIPLELNIFERVHIALSEFTIISSLHRILQDVVAYQ